ncbi:MAG: DUF2807 domain-containing protein [Sphingomonadaceae bacterium]
MLKKLIIVFASGLVLSLVAISMAFVIGGEELRNAIHDDELHWTIGDEDDGPRESREFAFDPDTLLTVRIPVELRFERGEEAKMVVEGSARSIDDVTFEGNVLDIDGEGISSGGFSVKIVAPSLKGLALEAPGNVKLRSLDQDAFSVTAEGAVDVDAEGKVAQLTLDSEGVGNLDFREVDARVAKVRLEGVGNAHVSASDLVDVELEGIGSLTLHRKPDRLVSQIDGIGRVKHNY